VAIGHGGVKSLENARQLGLNRKKSWSKACDNTAAEGLGSRLFGILNPLKSRRDQALALVSTARSERSA
jgi:hypothetical protein